MTRHGAPADYAMRVALANLGSTRIELIEQKAGDTVYAEFIRAHGYGVQHLGLVVDDIEAAIREAEAAGYRVTMDGAGFGLDGDGAYAYLDTEDELGTTFELIQRPKRRVDPRRSTRLRRMGAGRPDPAGRFTATKRLLRAIASH